MTITKTPTAKSGFTLIELSIVLVIIGLIVGGVLVGQDLIKAAEVRATDNGTGYDNEAPAFLKHLSEASLIADQVAFTSTIAGNVDSLSDASVAAKVGAGSRIIAYGATGLNYYLLAAGAAVTDGVITFSTTAETPVITAYQLDTKLDDGIPTTGRMITVTNMNTADSTTDACVGDSTSVYNIITTAEANATLCTLRIRASF